MRVHVVSDVHGSVDALARAGDGADALVCLGDLLLFVDYADHAGGIMGDLFGPEAVRRFVELRTARQYDEARAFGRTLWAQAMAASGTAEPAAAGNAGGTGNAGGSGGAGETSAGGSDGAAGTGTGTAGGPGKPGGTSDAGGIGGADAIARHRDSVVLAAVRRQYAALFAAFPVPTYLTYGNVDVPSLWPEFARDGVHVLDGATTTLDGWTFGFVGGGLRSPMRTPYELTEEEYAAKVAAVGAVDVLCAHIPPDLPELTYDVVARRFERGSAALLEAIRATRPRYVLFGHVHQPLQHRMRIGRTECVNVGHFRGRGTPYVLHW